MTHWSERYVGIRHLEFGRSADGADCWGIACLIYREQLGIELPDYVLGYTSADERVELAAIIQGAATSPLWAPVTALAMPFDIAIFRQGRLATHVGIVVHDGLMLHTVDGDHARIATYRSGGWSCRLRGVYRHRELASRSVQKAN